MNTRNDIFAPNNSADTFRNNSKFPIHFDRLHGGSYFRIISEPSRGRYRVRDNTLYQKAYDGFFAFRADDKAVGVCLMPNDLVMPVVKNNNANVLNIVSRIKTA